MLIPCKELWIKGASRDFTVLILTINAFQDPGFAGQGRGQLSAGGESQGGRGQDGFRGAAKPTVIFSSFLMLFDAYSDDRILLHSDFVKCFLQSIVHFFLTAVSII